MDRLPLSFEEIPSPELRSLLKEHAPTEAQLDTINDLIWALRLLPKGKEAALLANDFALKLCQHKKYKRGEMHIIQSLLYYGKQMFPSERHAELSKRFLLLAQEVGDALSEGYAYMQLAYFSCRTDISLAQEYSRMCKDTFVREQHALGVAKCYDLFAKIAQEQQQPEVALANFEQAYTSAVELGAEDLVVISAINLGAYYLRSGQHRQALDVLSSALALMKARARSIGKEDTFFCEYHYFSRSKTWVEVLESDGLAADVASNLGAVYLELSNLPLALEHFILAYKCIATTDSDSRKLILQFNIATVRKELGEYAVAFTEFQEVLQHAKKLQDNVIIFHAVSSLLDTVFNENTAREIASEISDEVLQEWFSDFEKSTAILPSSVYYPELLLQKARYAIYQHRWTEAQEYIHSITALHAGDSGISKSIVVQAMLLSLSTNITLQKTSEITYIIDTLHKLTQQDQSPLLRKQVLEEIIAKKNYLLQHNIVKAEQIITLYDELLLLVKNIFSEESDRRSKNLQIIHQVEQHRQALQEERHERERIAAILEQKRKELLSSALAVIRKNEVLDAVRRRILEVFGSGEQLRRQLTEVAGSITDALNADQEWQVFETQFKALNGEFMEVIERRYPALSQQEIKIAALLRTGLNTKDIAKLFLLEIRTVENHRTNIRRKLALDKKDDLVAFLKTV